MEKYNCNCQDWIWAYMHMDNYLIAAKINSDGQKKSKLPELLRKTE